MFDVNPNAHWRTLLLAVSLPALLCAAPAFGQTATDQADQEPVRAKKTDKKTDSKQPTVLQTRPTSPNATVNLVNLLVKQGVLKEEQAQALIKQAEDEAYVASEAAKDATARAGEAAKAATAASVAAQPPGTRHVTYVPEIVKKQLRDEIKQEVMAKAQKENWASPGAYPEWAERIHFSGDVRLRYQGDFFPRGNDQAEAINFNTLNTGSPFDLSQLVPGGPFLPTYDASQNRNQTKLRARLGMDADLYNGFTAGLRIATGDNSSPVSTNQTLGTSPNGSSGSNFSKPALWLDRGYLKWQGWGDNLVVSGGRFDNPFWSPTDLVWYKELGFDGFAVQGKYQVTENVTPFAVAGAFPIYNTDLNAGINLGLNVDSAGNVSPIKLASQDKWLFGGQAGVAVRLPEQSSVRFAAAYYDFDNVQGQFSSPCSVLSSSDTCDTDFLRPAFAQKGNTYMVLRNFISSAANNFNQSDQFQFFGLASAFRPLVASGQLDLGYFHPAHIVLDGEYVLNTAFKRDAILATDPVNNFAGSPIPGTFGPYNGGGMGWLARLTVGNTEIKQLGDWNVHAGYKYLQSDATIDAFVDSDFGLGGTNLKGYFVGGNLGLSQNVWATLRWMSANNIAGSPYAVDVLQVDLNARF